MQAEFRDGTLSNDSTWKTVVLIPKVEGGDLWGIGLVEVLWKTVTGLLNRRFTSAIRFYDVFHGFRAGCGTRTTTPGAKLLQQLMAMM